MTLTVAAEPLPFRIDEYGSARVGGTRVTMDTLIGLYRTGERAEALHDDFPTVALADIHALIAYYLRHTAEVDAYLAQRKAEGDALRAKIEAETDVLALKKELNRRWEARSNDSSSLE